MEKKMSGVNFFYFLFIFMSTLTPTTTTTTTPPSSQWGSLFEKFGISIYCYICHKTTMSVDRLCYECRKEYALNTIRGVECLRLPAPVTEALLNIVQHTVVSKRDVLEYFAKKEVYIQVASYYIWLNSGKTLSENECWFRGGRQFVK